MEPAMDQPTSNTSCLPAGFVGREEAARISGIGITAWKRWEAEGKVACGQRLTLPGGGRCRIYPIEAVQQMMRELDLSFPPPGTVDRHEAARMFGVAGRTFSEWEKQGRITCGRLVSIPGQPGQLKAYPIEQLRRLVEEFKQIPPFPPPGFVTRGQTCRIIGIEIRTLTTWEQEGRFTRGVFSKVPGKPGRCRLYPIDEVEALAEQHRQLNAIPEPYPDPDRAGCWRLPVSGGNDQKMEAVIDEQTLPLVRGTRWWWSPGHRAGEGSVVRPLGRTRIPLHQIIMSVRGIKYRVGHLNGDPLDCRRQNLVVRTASQQKAATRKVMVKAGKQCSSRYKGVSRATPTERWTVAIKANGVVRQLGRFRSEIAAALAYDDAARELFGPHAQLNFSNTDEIAKMRAVAQEEENAAPPPFPPPGFIDRRGACRMFGVGFAAWKHWERTGRVRCGQWVLQPLEKHGGKCRIYPIDELKQLLEEFNNIGKPYPDRDWPGCWRVPIRSMVHRMEAIIDAEDMPLVEGKYWNWSPKSDCYSARVTLATMGRAVPLARVIARVTDPEQKVSHVNRDPLDCRRANLIVRTMAEQAPANRKMGTVSGRKYTSNFKGVSWDASRGKWKAQVTSGEMRRHIGRFSDEIAAAEAYDEAARQSFGENAYLNFPDGVDAWLEGEAERLREKDKIKNAAPDAAPSAQARAA